MARGVIGMTGLAYMGVSASTPPELKVIDRAPVVGDNFTLPLGGFWLHPAGKTSYQLMSLEGGEAFYAKIYQQGTNGQVLIAKDGDNPIFATITSNDSSINFTLGENTLDMSASATGFSWTTVTSATNLVINNGYVSYSVARLEFTLPATASVGDVFKIRGLGIGGWKIIQNAGQKISSLEHTSTEGVTGYIESTHKYNGLDLECIDDNNHFRASNKDGNIKIV